MTHKLHELRIQLSRISQPFIIQKKKIYNITHRSYEEM